MAIAMAAGVISCLVSSWMISHFGIKPVNGGRPAHRKINHPFHDIIGTMYIYTQTHTK